MSLNVFYKYYLLVYAIPLFGFKQLRQFLCIVASSFFEKKTIDVNRFFPSFPMHHTTLILAVYLRCDCFNNLNLSKDGAQNCNKKA